MLKVNSVPVITCRNPILPTDIRNYLPVFDCQVPVVLVLDFLGYAYIYA